MPGMPVDIPTLYFRTRHIYPKGKFTITCQARDVTSPSVARSKFFGWGAFGPLGYVENFDKIVRLFLSY